MTGSAANILLAPGKWTLDPKASTATFVAHQLGRAILGTIPIRSASAHIGPNRDIHSAHIELDIASISTSSEKRDTDLAKPSLLNTGQFPTLSVDIAPATWTGKGWQATGKIGVRGIELPVRLAITLDEVGTTQNARVLITTSFNRKPIRIKAPNFVIGKNIEVAVRATFKHETDRATQPAGNI